MRERSIRRAAVIGALSLSFSGLGASPVRAATFERVSGSDRFATAAAISRDVFSPGVDAAYVVTGSDFPDALAAAPAAAAEGAPLLLVTASEVPQATATELARLRPKRIVIVGDQNSVGEQVAVALDQHTTGPVVRRHGTDRFTTAAAVATASFQPGVGAVFIANGLNFPDGLSGGAAAGKVSGPVLFVERDVLPNATAQALDALEPSVVYILGGVAAVSSSVEAQLEEHGTVVRLSGENRFATSAAISSTVFDETGIDTVYLATGATFPDALAGGPAAAFAGGPLLLTSRDCMPAEVAVELDRLDPERVVVLGGPSAVGDAVLSGVACASSTPGSGIVRVLCSTSQARVELLDPSSGSVSAVLATYSGPHADGSGPCPHMIGTRWPYERRNAFNHDFTLQAMSFEESADGSDHVGYRKRMEDGGDFVDVTALAFSESGFGARIPHHTLPAFARTGTGEDLLIFLDSEDDWQYYNVQTGSTGWVRPGDPNILRYGAQGHPGGWIATRQVVYAKPVLDLRNFYSEESFRLELEPDCSPVTWIDRSRLLCTGDSPDHGDLRVVTIDFEQRSASVRELLPASERHSSNVILSAAKRDIVFESNLGKIHELYVIPVTGGEPRLLGPAQGTLLDWR